MTTETGFMRCVQGVLTGLILITAGPAIAQDPMFASRAAALYATAPVIAGCQAGVLSKAERTRVVDTLNAVRALHGLAPVVYDPAGEDQMMQTALMMAASGKLDHRPGRDFRCYSEAGAAGAGLANLNGGVISPYLGFEPDEEIVIGWLTDLRNAMPGIGHRRWLLDPFLKTIAFGRVAGPMGDAGVADAAALKVMPVQPGPAGAAPPFVAYPFNDYPARFWGPGALLSFGVLLDPSDRWANRAVDYSAVTLSVRRRGGEAVAVLDQAFDTDAFGLANNLQFRVAALEPGVTYDVSIRGVVAGGVRRDFDYWFRVTP